MHRSALPYAWLAWCLLLSVKCGQTCSAAFCSPWLLTAETHFCRANSKAFVRHKRAQESNSLPILVNFKTLEYYDACKRLKLRSSTISRVDCLGTSQKQDSKPYFTWVSFKGLPEPYLCSTALLRRSFSLFSTAASGLTWEIFSSSVPLMLDAWLVEGVSCPESWRRRQGEQRFHGSSPVTLVYAAHSLKVSPRGSWIHFWVCPWLLLVKQHGHPRTRQRWRWKAEGERLPVFIVSHGPAGRSLSELNVTPAIWSRRRQRAPH